MQSFSFWKPFGSSAGLGPSNLGVTLAGRGHPPSLLDGCFGGGSERWATPSWCDKVEAFQDLTWEMYFSLHVSQSPTQSQALSGTTTFQVTRLMTGRNVFCSPAKMSCPLLLKQGHGHQNFSTSLPQERLLEFTVPGGDNRLWCSPCSFWILLQQAKGNVALCPCPCSWDALKGSGQSSSAHRKERWRPCCRDDHQWSRKSMELGMSLGLAVTTAHCKATFNKRLIAIMKFNNTNMALHG